VKKIFFVAILLSLLLIGAFYCHKRNNLQKEYVDALEKKESEYIKSFYQDEFRGIITYIKKYHEQPDEYVVGIRDNNKMDRTIGKVEISNFQDIKGGDSIRKTKNSYVLNIFKKNTNTFSLVKYKLSN